MGAVGTGLAGELGFKRRDNPKAYWKAWRDKNRDANNAYMREYYHTKTKLSPIAVAKRRDSGTWVRRKAKYGITKEQYLTKLDKQEGNCYICHEYYGNELRVDHNHETGQVRALLCNNCNTMIGNAKEIPSRLIEAADYLIQPWDKGV